ncbi:MAG TPA: YeeE/YedE thiosulfate transporter family protein [Roseateles sp.]
MAAAVWFTALLCVGAMGYAIQRGGTCMVAAVDEVLNHRRAHRLAAMLEASLWVAGGLALAQLLHVAGSMPAGFATNAWTVLGGALLGLGAWLNQACVFGAIARLGSGDWAYAATPVGFYAGCLSVQPLFSRPAAQALSHASPFTGPAEVIGPLFVAYACWRLWPVLLSLGKPGRLRTLARKVWTPHAATSVIGASFVVTLLLAGNWAYTDVLADLARMHGGMRTRPALLPLLLLAALYVGALLGGLTAGRWRSAWPGLTQLLRCFAGGVLMGWGSLLIPGSNDGLILIGIPMLRPYAWLALASMFLVIAGALRVQSRWRVPAPA